jgi:phosphatidylserine/phosphatidylglycerophosphate/cardiolipin synthase-like enzyme
MNEAEARVVVTGTAWMGGGIGSIESALEQLFREAQQEIALTAYSMSTGADLLFDWMEAALARGVQISLIINHLDDHSFEVVSQLRRFVATYAHFHLYNFLATGEADLHAKVIVADRRVALVGSSNLSRRGLLANHEMAVLIQGAVASSAASALDRLLKSRNVVRVLH